jgi:hypothetical protein
MQSDAHPNQSIQSHRFSSHMSSNVVGFSQSHDRFEYFLQELENLLAQSTPNEAEAFWVDADRIKSRYRVASVMNEIEALLVTFASVRDEANILKEITEQVRAYGKRDDQEASESTIKGDAFSSFDDASQRKPEIPSFLIKRRDINRG